MTFDSNDYIVFLITVLIVYWFSSHKAQNIFLLLASYFFYGYIHQWFLILIFTSTVVDYFCGLAIVSYPLRKKVFLILSLSANLGMLAVFKYFNFFIDNFNYLFNTIGISSFSASLNFVLPVGISFYTFQTLSYTLEVYRGDLQPRKNFLDFALFVAFFPQLVAGPIERAHNLIPQIESKRNISVAKIQDGLFLLVWGFFKKLVIADNVGLACNRIFSLEEVSFSLLWVGVFAFCIQIFADFSAYTDIARGTAKFLGFDLIKNFNHPYIAISPSEFWKRWHISLSYWIRDFIYIPLGGSRAVPVRAAFNLLFTFFLCGLWHGSSWNFVIWGVYHGVLILLYRYIGKLVPSSIARIKALIPIRVIIMFIFTNIGWLIFRESDLNYLYKHLTLIPGSGTYAHFEVAMYILGLTFLYSLPLWIHIAFDLGFKHIPDRFFPFKDVSVFTIKTMACALMVLGMAYNHRISPLKFIYFSF